jgi:hypothetical protein
LTRKAIRKNKFYKIVGKAGLINGT